MYKIYLDDDLIWTNMTPDVGIYDAKINLQVNSSQTFTYTIAKGFPSYNKHKMLTSVLKIYQDDEKDPLFEGRPLKESVDFNGNKTVEFEGALGYLNDSIQRPHNYTGQSISNILGALLDIHNQQVEDYKKIYLGNVTVIDTTDDLLYSGGSTDKTNYYDLFPADSSTGTSGTELKTDYESTFEAINNLLINNLAGYLNIRYSNGKKYLDYLKEYLPNEGQTILFGSNMLDLSSTLDYSSLCTGVLALGATIQDNDGSLYPSNSSSTDDTTDNKLTIASVNNGSDILWSNSAVQNFGKIVKKVEWSTIQDASKLKDKAAKYLTNKQYDTLTIESKIIDLHFVDKSVTPLHFLHMVRVISKPHDMDREFPISSMEIDLLNPTNDIVTLGQTYNTITGKMASTEKEVGSARNDISNVATTVDNNAESTNETNNYFSTSISNTNEQILLEAEKRENDTVTLRSEISIKADEIKSECNNYTDGKHSEIVQTADKISSRVSDTEGRCSSIEQTVDSITNRVGNCETQLSDHGFRITNAQQTADAAKAAAQSAANTASNANSQYNTLKSQLSSGTTTINGACIETGSIDSTKIKAIDISKVQEDGIYRVVSEKSFNDSGSEKLKACVASMLTNETAAKRAMANYVQNRLEQFKRNHPSVNW